MLKLRHSLNDRDPYDFRINVKIPVHQMMSHANNQSPRYGGMLLSKLRGQVSARLANDLQPAHHPRLRALISIKRLAGGLIPLDARNGIQDIQQAGAIASHNTR